MTTGLMEKSPANALHRRGSYNRRNVIGHDEPPADWDVPKTSAPLRERLRVLVVDDHRDSADTLSTLIGVWGHDVKRAYDGATGLTLAKSYRPHVLLFDVMMPKMSGIDLAPQLRQLADWNDCLMIAVTGRTDATTRRQCEQAGIDLLLVKPVDLANLKLLLTLESDYRWHLQQVMRDNNVSPVKAARRPGTGLVRRAGRTCDVLHDAVAT
jgi:CheY-like chemotaxis protein